VSLFNADLKLQWAKKHLDTLASEISIFQKTNTYHITTEEDLEGQWYLIRAHFSQDERVFTCALIAADFIHNLRASLDHLAWQLAYLSGHVPTREICFPICERDSVDTQIRIAKSTYGMPDAAVMLIKSFQPYKYGDAYKSAYLWRINDLCNIDKHRHLAPHGVSTEWMFHIALDNPTDVGAQQLEDGLVIKIPLALKDKIRLNPNPGVDMRFGDKATGDDLGISDFVEMYEFVAHTVIPSFASFFAQSKTGG
jgi:hypothetical protein